MTSSSDAAVELNAWFELGKLLRNGFVSDGNQILSRADCDAGAFASARCCRLLLRIAAQGGAAAGSQPTLLDAVHECNLILAVPDRVVALDSDAAAEVRDVLRAVIAACEKSPDVADVAATVVAHYTLATAAVEATPPDDERAARHLRRALAVAQRVGSFPDERSRKVLTAVAHNLAQLEATTREELQLIDASYQRQLEGSNPLFHVREKVMLQPRPACSACGKTPLTTKACGGTCGGQARFCDAACFAAGIRQHMRESGCKKRK